jgi:hypothetical protein
MTTVRSIVGSKSISSLSSLEAAQLLQVLRKVITKSRHCFFL